ncbi:hypothetical protein ANCCAN_21460 [Ancylostoma caninum]|uniref:7TM GPCR serpentine receptor class x (Srx) domain-containing protein n=1 Tax=Ancylostoma caninum TaxID=29170 RepID=A0A368FPF7_ANCCA|nr:hypothetical protein ANCCAN_21460 [Ancylostoma caninum]
MQPTNLAENFIFVQDSLTFNDAYGILIVITSCSVILLYCLILKVILSDNEMNQLIVYRFIILLGVCDLLEASVHCVAGFGVIFPNFWSLALGNILGSILVPAYFCYILTGLLLAFVRFMQIVYPEHATMLFFSSRGKYWLIIVPVVFLPYFGLMFSPLSMCVFSLSSYTWEYDLELPLAHFILYIEQYVQQAMIGITCVFYVVIFIVLWKLGNVNGVSSHRERLIMYQTFFVTVYATILNITYHNMWYVFRTATESGQTMRINGGNVPQVFALGTYMWVLNTAVYPLSCLGTNRLMREKLASFWIFRVFSRKKQASMLRVKPSSHI